MLIVMEKEVEEATQGKEEEDEKSIILCYRSSLCARDFPKNFAYGN